MKKMVVKPILIKSRTEKGSIYKVSETNSFSEVIKELYWRRRHQKDIAYHLYLIAPHEKFQNGEPVYVEKYPWVWEYQKAPCPMPYWGNPNMASKIVASTDVNLELPLIPKSFINEYIFRQGDIDEFAILAHDGKPEINSDNEVKILFLEKV